jgi:hypothetical protein
LELLFVSRRCQAIPQFANASINTLPSCRLLFICVPSTDAIEKRVY